LRTFNINWRGKVPGNWDGTKSPLLELKTISTWSLRPFLAVGFLSSMFIDEVGLLEAGFVQ
jgi:hypothetical protein